MAEKTLFERIIAREIPATIIYEDDRCIAFNDTNPQAPFHALVVPTKAIPKVSDAEVADESLLGHLLIVAARVAREAGYGAAFRMTINNGAGAGQSVFHVHVHVLAGRPLSWPPG